MLVLRLTPLASPAATRVSTLETGGAAMAPLVTLMVLVVSMLTEAARAPAANRASYGASGQLT